MANREFCSAQQGEIERPGRILSIAVFPFPSIHLYISLLIHAAFPFLPGDAVSPAVFVFLSRLGGSTHTFHCADKPPCMSALNTLKYFSKGILLPHLDPLQLKTSIPPLICRQLFRLTPLFMCLILVLSALCIGICMGLVIAFGRLSPRVMYDYFRIFHRRALGGVVEM